MNSPKGSLFISAIFAAGFFIMLGQAQAEQRIVSTMPSNTEILYELGLGDQVVGVSAFSDYPREAQKKPSVGGMILNYEKIVALRPTLVIMNADAQAQDVARMRALGLPVVGVHGNTLRDVTISMATVGAVTGRFVPALKMTLNENRRIQTIQKRAREMWNGESPSAFVQIWDRPLIAAGQNSLVGDIVSTAGLSNVAGGAGYPLYSLEKLLMQNPYFIIVPSGSISRVAQMQKNPAWNTLSAVQNNRVVFIDENLLVRAGPRAILGLEMLMRQLEAIKGGTTIR